MPSDQMLEQAAEWFARLRCEPIDPQDLSDWQNWYNSHNEHQQAWRYIEQVQQQFAPLHNLPAAMPLHKTLAHANQRLTKRRSVLLSLLFLTGGSFSLGWLWRNELSQQSQYWLADLKTITGQQNQHLLSDGTQLWLNTYSAVNLKFDQQTRLLEFITGEIFIKTAKDPRPLQVATAYAKLTALGTEFNILEKPNALELTVNSGAVRIELADKHYVIKQGQTALFNRNSVTISQDNAHEAPSWISAVLIADNLPLIAVVAELRRYFSGHIGVHASLEQLRVYGRFPITQTLQSLQLLADSLPIQINQRFAWWISLEPQTT